MPYGVILLVWRSIAQTRAPARVAGPLVPRRRRMAGLLDLATIGTVAQRLDHQQDSLALVVKCAVPIFEDAPCGCAQQHQPSRDFSEPGRRVHAPPGTL